MPTENVKLREAAFPSLRTIREATGLSQVQLARELGLTRQAVSETEHKARVKPITRERYLAAIARCAAQQAEAETEFGAALIEVGAELLIGVSA